MFETFMKAEACCLDPGFGRPLQQKLQNLQDESQDLDSELDLTGLWSFASLGAVLRQ